MQMNDRDSIVKLLEELKPPGDSGNPYLPQKSLNEMGELAWRLGVKTAILEILKYSNAKEKEHGDDANS